MEIETIIGLSILTPSLIALIILLYIIGFKTMNEEIKMKKLLNQKTKLEIEKLKKELNKDN